MTPAEYAFLERARVGALATVDEGGRPHAVPVCFALLERTAFSGATYNDESGRSNTDDNDGVRIVSAIDEKPKTTRELQRVRNVRTNPLVTLLVDRYREDWSRLAWVQVRGRARILAPDAPGHDAAVNALETEYEQYADHDLDGRPIVSIRVGRTVSWGTLEPDEAIGDD